MRIFDHPNMANFTCPVCGTADDTPVVLVAIQRTIRGGIAEARQYHVGCLGLVECDLPGGAVLLCQRVPK
jgi:hypothetical protein